jgi:hypothetical protein
MALTKATELAQLSRKLTYNESTDVANIDGDGSILTTGDNTDQLQEGTTNLYFTNARIDSHLSGGTGITYSNGAISFDASTAGLDATDISFDNTQTGYVASNVQSAIDELFDKKLDITALNAAVVFYATDAASDIATYFKLVTGTDDADYDDTPVNIPTGTITADDQFIAALASAPGVFSGATGQINVHTIGNVRKTSGNKDGSFYFEVYIRDGSDNETLIGTSSTTSVVNNVTYQEFVADSLIDSTAFGDTDRVVLKFYGNQEGTGGNAAFEFQFGGTSPVRTNFPVPVTVVPHENDADDILVDTSGFSGILSSSDDDVQTALATIDTGVGIAITTAINNLVNSAPGTLDTLNELAAALGDDPNFATTTATSLADKISRTTDDTDALSEGSTNLYYTDGRVQAVVTQSYINSLNVDADTVDGKHYDEIISEATALAIALG